MKKEIAVIWASFGLLSVGIIILMLPVRPLFFWGWSILVSPAFMLWFSRRPQFIFWSQLTAGILGSLIAALAVHFLHGFKGLYAITGLLVGIVFGFATMVSLMITIVSLLYNRRLYYDSEEKGRWFYWFVRSQIGRKAMIITCLSTMILGGGAWIVRYLRV